MNIWKPRAVATKGERITTAYAKTSTTYVRLRATINGETITGDTGATWSDAVDNLVTAVDAANNPYFDLAVFSNQEDPTTSTDCALRLLGTNDGVPFLLTSVEAYDSGLTTWGAVAIATTVDATGPAHWDNPLNWTDESGTTLVAAPTSGICLFDNTDQGVLYGIGSADACVIHTGDNFTGAIGLLVNAMCIDTTGENFEPVPEHRAELYMTGGTDDWVFSGAPRYISFKYLVDETIGDMIFKSTNESGYDVQESNIEIRVYEVSVATSANPLWTIKSGSVNLINIEDTYFDVKLDINIEDGILHLNDVYEETVTNRFRNINVFGGEVHQFALVDTVNQYEGTFYPRDFRILNDYTIEDGTLDMTGVETVAITGDLDIFGGEVLSDSTTPTISFVALNVQPRISAVILFSAAFYQDLVCTSTRNQTYTFTRS